MRYCFEFFFCSIKERLIMRRLTTSFKDAVTKTLIPESKMPPVQKKRPVSKKRKVVSEVYGGGSLSSDAGPGGWNVVQSKGWGGSMPPFAKYSQQISPHNIFPALYKTRLSRYRPTYRSFFPQEY